MGRELWESAFEEALRELREIAPAARAADVHPNTVRYHLRTDTSFRVRCDQALGLDPSRRSRP